MTLEHLPPPERRRIANALFGVGWDATLDRARIVLLDTGTPAVGEAR
jgi:hypothetical protein